MSHADLLRHPIITADDTPKTVTHAIYRSWINRYFYAHNRPFVTQLAPPPMTARNPRPADEPR